MALGRCEANSSQIKVAIWHKKDGASVRRSALLGGDGGVKLRPVAQQCVRLLYRQRSGFTALGLGLAVESRHLGAAFGNFAIVARIQMLACCGTGDRSCRGNGWHIGLGSKTPGIGALISRYRGGTSSSIR